jgi:hypothetical protein
MLDNTQNVVLLVSTVSASMLFMGLLNRAWPPTKRHEHNDLIGWQLSILGTTYAVILGFMLYTVWTTYGEAEQNANLEANSLRNLYRIAQGLPSPQSTELQKLCRSYADAVLNKDWPEMENNQLPEESLEIDKTMWNVLMSVKTSTQSEASAEDHTITELSSLTEHRRTRLLQSVYRLPSVLWFVLIVGGIVTIASASMFGASNAGLHAVQVLFFSLLISLVLIAIADINRPFTGSVHVSDYAFQRAKSNMND